MGPNPPITLEELQKKEAELTKSMGDLEREIYATEGLYLENTAADGNLVRGWGGLLSALEMDAVVDRRYKKFKKERVFSKSSATSRAAVTGEDILDPEEKSRSKQKR